MQTGFQVLHCICKLQINGIARYYVSGGKTSINLNNYYVSKPVYSYATRHYSGIPLPGSARSSSLARVHQPA